LKKHFIRRAEMIYTALTKKALKLCFKAHKDQVDKTDIPYVFHPFHLAEQMTDEITTVCALLHDVVEDTDYTLSDLTEMGFPKEVTDALELLTHDPAVPYMDYVAAVAVNPVARAVKIADLKHNSDLTRMEPSQIDEWALRRNEKYKRALELLGEK
jgi:(p)ppGpp synthase/HD superfamily hydrolase